MRVAFVDLLLVAVVAASALCTGFLRRHALATLLLDIPNDRSSHSVPTPRGGGVAIVIFTIGGLLIAGAAGLFDRASLIGVCGGGAMVALIGAIDDRKSVAARWRLLFHFTGAACALATLGAGLIPEASTLRIVALILAALFVVWMLNLTNFMDGIDGIAAVETITVCIAAAVITEKAAPHGGLWIGPAILAAATAGFLFWNWPPAKIFMGDAGSGFLGFTMAVFALQAGTVERRLFWVWTILLAVFIVDATVTLLTRLARGERVYQAHRSHAYQHATARIGAHRPVTIGVGLVNLFWLFPIAALVATSSISISVAMLLTYLPLMIAAFRMRAGRSNVQ